MIFMREGAVFDQAAMDRYSALNRSNAGVFRERYGIRPLAVYGKTEALEGPAPDGLLILEFPDAKAARAWYDSPEYQEAVLLRKQGAEYRALLIEGLPTT
jgi:uncharacterized protein (DUF1330 family)